MFVDDCLVLRFENAARSPWFEIFKKIGHLAAAVARRRTRL
ncbi:MAG TPA: hypothetical protein VHD62_14075 [Opitutaceae bacterium]|nr:hypothetical protein [Opitutaceae bacterium]